MRESLAGEESLATLVEHHARFGPEAAASWPSAVAVRRRTTPGGAGPAPVQVQLQRFGARLATDIARLADR